jgi:hypothetical protein
MRELSIVRENLAPKEKRPAGPLLFSYANCKCGLDAFDVFRLPALGAFHYVELNLLTFLQAAKAIRLDGGEMNENILAILAADKTITLGIVKPLDCSCFHVGAVSLLLKCVRLEGAALCRQDTLWSGVTAEGPQISNAAYCINFDTVDYRILRLHPSLAAVYPRVFRDLHTVDTLGMDCIGYRRKFLGFYSRSVISH